MPVPVALAVLVVAGIVVADLFYRAANLEHAAASITNVFNSLLMLVMLGVVVTSAASPPMTILNVHPGSFGGHGGGRPGTAAATGYRFRGLHHPRLLPGRHSCDRDDVLTAGEIGPPVDQSDPVS